MSKKLAPSLIKWRDPESDPPRGIRERILAWYVGGATGCTVTDPGAVLANPKAYAGWATLPTIDDGSKNSHDMPVKELLETASSSQVRYVEMATRDGDGMRLKELKPGPTTRCSVWLREGLATPPDREPDLTGAVLADRGQQWRSDERLEPTDAMDCWRREDLIGWGVYQMDRSELVVAISAQHASEIWQEEIGYEDDPPIPADRWVRLEDDHEVAIPQHPDLGGPDDVDAEHMRGLGFTITAADDAELYGFVATGPASLWAQHYREQAICSAEWA